MAATTALRVEKERTRKRKRLVSDPGVGERWHKVIAQSHGGLAHSSTHETPSFGVKTGNILASDRHQTADSVDITRL